MGGTAYATSTTAKTISDSGKRLNEISFTLAGTNGKGVVLTDFSVTVVDPEQVSEEEEVPTDFTYTVDKANGNLYKNGTTENESWNNTWKSTTMTTVWLS